MVHKMIFFRIGSKNVHLPKLIGAFVIVAAVLMFFRAGALMFESWDNVKYLNSCLDSTSGNLDNKLVCQQNAYYSGVFVRLDQDALTAKQVWALLLEPIANLFFWAAVFLVGSILYLSGKIIVPIEETETLIKEKPKPKRSK